MLRLQTRPKLSRCDIQTALCLARAPDSVEGLAKALGIRFEAARARMRSLRDKTGMRKQSDLVLWAFVQKEWLNAQSARYSRRTRQDKKRQAGAAKP